ncbi:hypothetical protein CROQUDRAFT_665698 [Cronartium quercuum f. sp. fusiforme G11]|uniref:Arrestin C-terminal-like domain-containing protein n=1 Tax=Cronartium quercuum f. sp. fusiforme G11 TaxID=708437 RepID=A0A9P6T5M4_9BASI|nr:hypothetical protein CROQUDRAFT_665698 [Cronartium quercuum f. sp. fusiforme G11]
MPRPNPIVTTPASPPHHSAIDILLDSPDLVLRALSGNESSGQPAALAGTVELQLAESTHLKDILLILRAAAKIDYLDPLSGKRYHHHHPLFFHQLSFLPECSDASHTHTLQAGFHRFPFSVSLPADLPASLRTYSGSGLIYYKLKAVASRAGFLTSKWEAKKILRVARSFPAEAVEWNQTLEIENTWPGKVSYEISLPHKAFAAGDSIPVSLKFTPLMKGVRVTSLIVTIKEHVLLVGKTGSPPHVENRDVAECKYEFTNQKPGGSEPLSRADPAGPSRRQLSSSDLSLLTRRLQAVSLQPRRVSSSITPISALPSPSRSVFGHTRPGSSSALAELGNSTPSELLDEIHAELDLSQDIDTAISLAIPPWTTPSHTLAPVTVTHKLKFSAFIANPDGHTSELRCALPLIILAAHLGPEAALASAGARTLLFAASGTLDAGAAQAELPSYPDHVRDRLAAPLDTPSVVPAPWANSTPSTPGTSRPTSPSGGYFPAFTSTSTSSVAPSPARTPSHDAELIRSLDSSPIPPTPPSAPPSSVSSSGSGVGGSSSGLGGGFFQIHLPKTLRSRPPKALTAISPGTPSPSAQVVDERELMSRVPSYSVASRGSIGGGPVPLSSLVGLPSYEESSSSSTTSDH